MDVALRNTHRKDAVSFECEGQLTNVETEFGTSSSSDSKQIFNVLSHTTTPDAVAQDATTPHQMTTSTTAPPQSLVAPETRNQFSVRSVHRTSARPKTAPRAAGSGGTAPPPPPRGGGGS